MNPYKADTPIYEAYRYLLSQVLPGEEYEIFKDDVKYPHGLTLVIYKDKSHKIEEDMVEVDIDDFEN